MFLIIDIILIAISLYLCKKHVFEISNRSYSYISLTIPFVLAVMAYLSFFNAIFFYITLFAIVFSIYYYINKSADYLSAFLFKKAFHLLSLFIIMNIIGGILINLVRFNLISSKNMAILVFLLGSSIFAYARVGFISLASEIAKNKGLNKYLGFLGILGVIGIIILCILKPKK